jgi:sugar lactone lactonase YvrE
MPTSRIGTLRASLSVLIFFLLALASCAQSPAPVTNAPTGTAVPAPTRALASPPITVPSKPSPTPSPTSTKTAPARYTAHLLLRGVGRPDDLAFDPQGRLLFSDELDGTISRLNAGGSVTLLLRDPAGPEGMVVRPDGTIIYAEQETNRIMSLAPGASTPSVLRALPGVPSSASCKQGVDGIAFDPTTNTIIVPDSPTGAVYRMSLDGKTFTLLATGIVRPVGAGVDSQGTIYIADECGGAVWRITPGGKTTRIGGFGMPDDVVPDGFGNLLVIDLQPSIHALIRLNPTTGARETLASQGYIEPQGLVIDAQGNIYVSDDYANMIVKYSPS